MIYKNITDIKANPKNPRVIKDEKFAKLVKSLQDFPEMLEKRPLICFTDVDGKVVVLGGNMRLKAAKECGMEQLPVILADDWTEEQKNEFLIKDNVGFGEWNWEEITADWDIEQLGEWGLDATDSFEGDEVLEPENEKYPFQDEGILPKSQYGVIVMCESEGTQESVFNDLTKMGFKCKIVVT